MPVSLRILFPGFFTTVQDLGRVWYESQGVPVSGAMDGFALQAANALVGNPPGAAGLEFALQGPSLRLEQAGREPVLVALAGCGFTLAVDGRPIPAWMAALARPGESIELNATGRGGWGYLALTGGLDVPPVLGSRSTYVRGGLGGWQGRALQSGDVLPLGVPEANAYSRLSILEWAGRSLPPERRPPYAENPLVGVVLATNEPGGLFTAEAFAAFFAGEYTLTSAADRMGYRFAGPRLSHRSGADILSEGIPLGAVQVPGDGQPIVLLADRQTTGGYTRIATVTSASLPLLVQTPVGGRVRFHPVSVAEAQRRYRALMAGLS